MSAQRDVMSYQPSIRDRVANLQRTMLGEMTPDLARKSLVQLTGLMGLAAEHLRECELAYKRVLVAKLSLFEKANRAKIEAEATVQFADYREAQDVFKSLDQMTMSCKAYLRSLDTEMRNLPR